MSPWRSPAPDGVLLPWTELSRLGDHPERASGEGTYRTEFLLPEDFSPEKEVVVLELPQIRELFTVRVNGVMIPYPMTQRERLAQEITFAVAPGRNTLEIQVGSGLWNAAKYYNTFAHEKNPEIVPQLSNESWISPDGLMGCVLLRRYA